jgi:hypothetical protein
MLLKTGSTLESINDQEETALMAAAKRWQGNKAEVIEAVLKQYETNRQQQLLNGPIKVLNTLNPNSEYPGIIENINNVAGSTQEYVKSHDQGKLLFHIIQCSQGSKDTKDLSRSLKLLIDAGIDPNATFENEPHTYTELVGNVHYPMYGQNHGLEIVTESGIYSPIHMIIKTYKESNKRYKIEHWRLSCGAAIERQAGRISREEEEIFKKDIRNKEQKYRKKNLHRTLSALKFLLDSGADPDIHFFDKKTESQLTTIEYLNPDPHFPFIEEGIIRDIIFTETPLNELFRSRFTAEDRNEYAPYVEDFRK